MSICLAVCQHKKNNNAGLKESSVPQSREVLMFGSLETVPLEQ